MNRHRLGARGNATSFPMPWHDLLRQFKEEQQEAGKLACGLPHTGKELSSFVSVVVKTHKEEDVDGRNLSKFIHQAIVRRDVVVRLIDNARRRGHRAYRNIDMAQVKLKAGQELQEKDVPVCAAHLTELDELLDKIQVQKAATPVPGRTELAEVGKAMDAVKPNGVVLERSSNDEADINANRISAVQSLLRRLNGDVVSQQEASTLSDESEEDGASNGSEPGRVEASETKRKRASYVHVSAKAAKRVHDEYAQNRRVQRKEIATGNELIDQFEPWYFGVAFAFMFKYCTGMPDTPTFMRKPRYSRKDDAPYVETPAWMRIMGRRVESQVSRDWKVDFVSWNFVFRSSLNMRSHHLCV